MSEPQEAKAALSWNEAKRDALDEMMRDVYGNNVRMLVTELDELVFALFFLKEGSFDTKKIQNMGYFLRLLRTVFLSEEDYKIYHTQRHLEAKLPEIIRQEAATRKAQEEAMANVPKLNLQALEAPAGEKPIGLYELFQFCELVVDTDEVHGRDLLQKVSHELLEMKADKKGSPE
jgi:hypothetical protein